MIVSCNTSAGQYTLMQASRMTNPAVNLAVEDSRRLLPVTDGVVNVTIAERDIVLAASALLDLISPMGARSLLYFSLEPNNLSYLEIGKGPVHEKKPTHFQDITKMGTTRLQVVPGRVRYDIFSITRRNLVLSAFLLRPQAISILPIPRRKTFISQQHSYGLLSMLSKSK